MKQRWLPVGVLAGALFGVNVIARLIVRLAAGKDDGKQAWIGLISLVAVGLVVAGAAAWWMRIHLAMRVFEDSAVAVLAGCLLSSLVGPFISKGSAFAGGLGYFSSQLMYYILICALGGFLGALTVIALGRDVKTLSWLGYADNLRSKPHRQV